MASNVGLILAGFLLFLIQMHGYSHDAFVDDLAFSKASHHHEHLAMANNFAGAGDAFKTEPPVEPEMPQWKDTVMLTIAAGKSTEYKFHVSKGELLEYSWETEGGELFYDFHGEPKGDTTGYFESYQKRTESKSSGAFSAPFEGSHGWYWKNIGSKTVEITLKTKGAYKILGIR